MAYWLFKSEPNCFSFAHLQAEPGQTTGWDGVRNFQARNFLRDQVRVGDGVLFYHSSADPPAIAGIAEVVREGHADPTAFEPKAQHYDPKSDPASPTWYQVSIRAVQPIDPPLGLPELKLIPALKAMELLRKGSRLSVQPVSASEWDAIVDLVKERQTGRITAAKAKPAKPGIKKGRTAKSQKH
jgi:predicted RNA-binding protein with PUA-like domain